MDNSEPNIEFHSKLLTLNPAAKFYTNIQLCIDEIKLLINEKIFLIISNNLSSDILDVIFPIPSIQAIFIYNKVHIYPFISKL